MLRDMRRVGIRPSAQPCMESIYWMPRLVLEDDMILETDFLDHWKTRLFVETMGQEHASNYILRLWFHCQQRKTTDFPGMTPQILKVVCRYDGDAQKLYDAITQPEVGFAVGYPNGIRVPKWADLNGKLIANWVNGKTGGRPNKTHDKPNDNPTETQPEPNRNPQGTGMVRYGKVREEENKNEPSTPASAGVAVDEEDENFIPPGRGLESSLMFPPCLSDATKAFTVEVKEQAWQVCRAFAQHSPNRRVPDTWQKIIVIFANAIVANDGAFQRLIGYYTENDPGKIEAGIKKGERWPPNTAPSYVCAKLFPTPSPWEKPKGVSPEEAGRRFVERNKLTETIGRMP